jgi:hypothetical protein
MSKLAAQHEPEDKFVMFCNIGTTAEPLLFIPLGLVKYFEVYFWHTVSPYSIFFYFTIFKCLQYCKFTSKGYRTARTILNTFSVRYLLETISASCSVPCFNESTRVMVAYGCHNFFLKIVISLVKTVYLCFYVFTPLCHISNCHVHCVYVRTTEFINWIAVTNKLSLLTYFVFFSTASILVPTKIHCHGGCWDWTQDCCNVCTHWLSDALTIRLALLYRTDDFM